ERQAAGTAQPVTFTGFIPSRTAVATLLATADVVLAPGPVETFGLAALEALACGTPVVVSGSGALPEGIGGAGATGTGGGFAGGGGRGGAGCPGGGGGGPGSGGGPPAPTPSGSAGRPPSAASWPRTPLPPGWRWQRRQ